MTPDTVPLPAIANQTRLQRLHLGAASLIRTLRTRLGITSGVSFLAGLVVMLGAGGMYTYAHSGSTATQATQQIATVQKRDITSSIKSTGTVTFANEQTMQFNQKGTVAKVYFKEGDHVKEGQVIATLDQSSVLADIRSQQLSVSATALQLQQLKADQNQQIINAQNAVTSAEQQFLNAQNALTVSQQKLPGDIDSAKRDVAAKQAALDQAKVTAMQDLAKTAQDTLSQSEDLLDSLYGVLVNDGSARQVYDQNQTIEIYPRLYIDFDQKNKTETSYYAAVQAVDDMQENFGSSLSSTTDASKLSSALDDAYKVANAVSELADNTYQLLRGATDDPKDLTVADINKLKSTATSARTTATGLANAALSAKANLTAGSDGTVTSIDVQQAENALQASQQNLQVLQTQSPNTLQQSQQAVQNAQADYQAKQAALDAAAKDTDVSIKLKQNSLAQNGVSLQKAQLTLKDYQLIAPFDGVITHMDYKPGDNLVDTGETENAVIQNPNFIIVTVPLDQVDVVHVLKGMNAEISFDALPGQTFQGTIDDINPTAVQQSGVVSYDVQIKLPAPQGLTILSGMTTTVNIETAKKAGVLAVPSLALQYQGSTPTVQLATGESVPVQVGATDGQFTEITAGLTEGEQIVSFNIPASTASSAGNANAAQQLLRGAGGAAGFGGGFQGGGGTRTGRGG